MREKLLIVEDDLEIANILKEHLQKEGYEVNWSSTGKEGLEDFKQGEYDLLLVDIMLPEMDGFSLCKNIRLQSEVPILIISARQADLDKVKGFKLGADDYITKPFSLVEIAARVEAHLRRFKAKAYSESENILTFKKGLSITSDEKDVCIKEKKISLTAKEFDLLLLMAQNPNRTFSKKELYENIWGSADIDGNNTVTVHIKALREKLGDDIKNPSYIQTVWGTGYKFIGESL